MAVDLIVTAEAAQDIDQAFAWYENQRFRLGEEFLSCLDACIQRVSRDPEIYAVVHENYRRSLVRRFPYAVFYEYANKTVTIYAVFHVSRNPDRWRQRIS